MSKDNHIKASECYPNQAGSEAVKAMSERLQKAIDKDMEINLKKYIAMVNENIADRNIKLEKQRDQLAELANNIECTCPHCDHTSIEIKKILEITSS